MGPKTSLVGITTVSTLVLLSAACGGVGADGAQEPAAETQAELAAEAQQPGAGPRQEEARQQPAAATASAAGGGFFETLIGITREPVEVPAGATLSVRLNDTLSSHETAPGSGFTAEVTQEVSIHGRVAVPAGSVVYGHVTEAHPAKKIGGRAILSIAFDELQIADGDIVGLSASLSQAGKSQVGKDAAIISGSTIGGAILGEAIHEGEGTTVGAIAGAIGGTIGALKTKGKPVVLAQGTALHITVERPFTVEAGS